MESIKRHKYEKDFTIVNNAYLRDVNLSWKAKGLITYVTMLPDDWSLNISDLKNRSKDGRDSVYAGIKELRENGYCKVTQLMDGNKYAGVEYVISDYKAFDTFTEHTYTEHTYTEHTYTENPPLLSTKEKSTNGKKETKKEPEKKSGSLFPEINPNKTSLFRNSIFGNLNGKSVFLSKFNVPDFAGVDVSYYYEAVKDWSDSANKKRTAKGWIATARNFMRGDKEKKRLKMLVSGNEEKHKGAIDYLKM
ncbi:MAG: hypothetical protein HQ522_16240 [Bacteroidetes bacterium]|nr:hypothetical protein [Bacteroidota bacterium]